jgi:hypothetical protein
VAGYRCTCTCHPLSSPPPLPLLSSANAFVYTSFSGHIARWLSLLLQSALSLATWSPGSCCKLWQLQPTPSPTILLTASLSSAYSTHSLQSILHSCHSPIHSNLIPSTSLRKNPSAPRDHVLSLLQLGRTAVRGVCTTVVHGRTLLFFIFPLQPAKIEIFYATKLRLCIPAFLLRDDHALISC